MNQHEKQQESARKTCAPERTHAMRHPIRCTRCKEWMKAPTPSEAADGALGMGPVMSVRKGTTTRYRERMPAPNAGHCTTCFCEIHLRLPKNAADLLERCNAMLRSAQHAKGCWLGQKTKGTPEGVGHTTTRHGCTCGLTALQEELEDVEGIGLSMPLRMESLERTLKNITFRTDHIRLWKANKDALPAFNMEAEAAELKKRAPKRKAA